MKNQISISVLALAIVGIVGCTSPQAPAKSDSIMNNETPVPKDEVMMESTSGQMSESGYVEYTQAAFEKAVSNRRVLFFFASWCPTCKQADADLTAKAGDLPKDVTVLRVNYNDPDTDQAEKDLAKKYGITYQHTFVQIDEAGQEITKWNGGNTAELLAKIR